MKKLSVIIIGLAMMLACIGAASAAVLVNATPETQGITTQTIVQCDGIVSSSEEYATMGSNQVLDGAPLATGEVYSQATYSNRVSAVNGVTTYVKGIALNTQNQVGDGQNIATTQTLEFAGVRITGDESASKFNAGQATSGTEQFMCPFTAAAVTTVPPFNEAVTMGAHYDAGTIDEASQVGVTTTAKTGDVPSTISMNIAASGEGQIGTYMSVFAQDGRGTGQQLVTPATTKVIPGTKVTTVVEPGKTTTITVPGHWEGCKWIPEKTTVTTTDPKTKTVTTKDQTVNVPAVYTAVTPSSTVQYHEATSAMGNFVFSKNMQYTSQVTG
jgi:hypothetical protein